MNSEDTHFGCHRRRMLKGAIMYVRNYGYDED
jgi:hypothetical protein